MSEPVILDAASVDAIARRVAELVAPTATDRWMTVSEIADRFSVSSDYIYEHKAELGAVRLGDGPRSPIRFDPAKVAVALDEDLPDPEEPTRRRPNHKPSSVELLPIGRPK